MSFLIADEVLSTESAIIRGEPLELVGGGWSQARSIYFFPGEFVVQDFFFFGYITFAGFFF